VCGIAQLGNEIFVSSDSSPSIAVFVFQGQQNFVRQKDIGFKQLTTPPQDIATSADFQQLFVADLGGECIWQLQWLSRGEFVVEGQAVSKVKPVSLSMNASRLLVVEKRRLIIFLTSEKERKPIKLPENLEAEHALETPCATYIVCGQRVAKPDGVKKPSIMEVNRQGGPIRECDPQYLGLPCYLSAFSDVEGDLLVVDCQNQRILVLSSLLKVVRVFLDVVQPRRIVKSGHFLVGCVRSSNHRGVVSLYWPQKSMLQTLPD